MNSVREDRRKYHTHTHTHTWSKIRQGQENVKSKFKEILSRYLKKNMESTSHFKTKGSGHISRGVTTSMTRHVKGHSAVKKIQDFYMT